jgi:hypothetical protein
MAQRTVPAQGSQPGPPVYAAASPHLLEPNQGQPPMHDSATDNQPQVHMIQLDRLPCQTDGKSAARPPALLQAPACALCPVVMGGSCDEGDQPATEVATVIESPATAVATSDSGVAGRSHTNLGTTELPADDVIEVIPCIYLTICLLP